MAISLIERLRDIFHKQDITFFHFYLPFTDVKIQIYNLSSAFVYQDSIIDFRI